MSLHKQPYIQPTLKIGVGGNYYVICDTKDDLIPICIGIGKSVNSVYFNKKYECWTFRVKLKRHKRLLLKMF